MIRLTPCDDYYKSTRKTEVSLATKKPDPTYGCLISSGLLQSFIRLDHNAHSSLITLKTGTKKPQTNLEHRLTLVDQGGLEIQGTLSFHLFQVVQNRPLLHPYRATHECYFVHLSDLKQKHPCNDLQHQTNKAFLVVR